MILALNDPVFLALKKAVAGYGKEAYLVGGYVRDRLLQRESKDIDVVVVGDGTELAAIFAEEVRSKEVAYFKNYGTAMVKTNGWDVEFVGARRESYAAHSRNPSVSPGSLQDDQNRRDFTINALAISLQEPSYGTLVDPFNGLADLDAKLIRTPLDPDITFSDDPLRMMRAIRFSAQLQFQILDETYQAIARNKERIQIISGERIADELHKIILSPKPSAGFKQLFDTGLIEIIFPELHALQGVETIDGQSHKDNFYHTLMVVDQIAQETDNLWLRWAALLHDIAKPATKRFSKGEGWTFHGHEDRGSRMVSKLFRKLKLPLNEKMKYVEKLVGLHHRPKALAEEGVTDSAIRRIIVDAGDDLEDLFTLCRADMTSANPHKIQRYRQNLKQVQELVAIVSERDALRNFQPPVSGEDIMEIFGLGPSKEVGKIKTEIRESILEGKIKNTREEALNLMYETAKSMGLTPVKPQ